LQQKFACLPTTPVYCADTIPCKNYDPLTRVYIVLKRVLFTVCNKFARCHPNLIILGDILCQKNFVTKLLRHSAQQTWLCMLQLYLVRKATIWECANHEVHVSKVEQ